MSFASISFADDGETVLQTIRSYTESADEKRLEEQIRSKNKEYLDLPGEYGRFFNGGENMFLNNNPPGVKSKTMSAYDKEKWYAKMLERRNQRLEKSWKDFDGDNDDYVYKYDMDIDVDGDGEKDSVGNLSEHIALNKLLQEKWKESRYNLFCVACNAAENCCGDVSNFSGESCRNKGMEPTGGPEGKTVSQLAEISKNKKKCKYHNYQKGTPEVSCKSGRFYIDACRAHAAAKEKRLRAQELPALNSVKAQLRAARDAGGKDFMKGIIAQYVDGHEIKTQHCVDQSHPAIDGYNELRDEDREKALAIIRGSIQK